MSLDIPSANPSAAPPTAKVARGRIPMSVPRQKLAVPDIPGYHLHWMLGTPERLAQARAAGYEFVERDETQVTNTDISSGDDEDGNSDLGSRVTRVAGGDTDSGGQAVRLVLMKLRQEWWEDDQKKLESKSDDLIAALRSGRIDASEAGETQGDRAQRYIPKNRTSSMFQKRRP